MDHTITTNEPKTRRQSKRIVRRPPMYSRCCGAAVLGEFGQRRLYCHKCRKTIRSFVGCKRIAAIKQVEYLTQRCRVDAMLFGQTIAYARDVPNLVWRNRVCRKQGRSKYKYFINGSSLVIALGLQQCQTEDGFRSLGAAVAAMKKVIEGQHVGWKAGNG